ncbi:SUKH superfamily protein [Tenacibaculum skagerrakense]|uniref:SUKH superfamily protein n=1 Tax=Tenacibaculum skagerrakense TaxID=186571 RepID=A0A4R2P4J4_9FLAO|nr:SMI1/KNR4 family protein [Tenacibaculum skagerrakense]TCP28675.1 SUKH superfamily protein [Tenacibaculum skagerrakense]
MENLEHYWGRIFDHSTCEPLTDGLIEEAEKHFKVKFPDEYLKLLKYRNGGFLRFTNHPKIDLYNGQIFGIGHSDDSIFSTDLDFYTINEEGQEVPFPKNSSKLIQLNNGFGAIICLDYRSLDSTSEEPKITVINPDSGSDYVIASSFKEFLSNLKYDSSYYEFAIESEMYSDEELINLIEASFKFQFEDLRSNPSFKSLRGKVTSADYEEITTIHSEYGTSMTQIKGKSDLVWLVPNIEDDGYINHPEHKNTRWIFKIGNDVFTKAEIQNRIKETHLTVTLVHDLDSTKV